MLPMDASVKMNGNGDAESELAKKVIGTRIGELAPLVMKWQDEHKRVPMARLVEDGLKLALKRYAGKRYAHLVAEEKEGVAA